jgi:hypothetical protein
MLIILYHTASYMAIFCLTFKNPPHLTCYVKVRFGFANFMAGKNKSAVTFVLKPYLSQYMKKSLSIIATAIIVIAISMSTLSVTHSNPSGAPAGVTGSPGDGNQTCARSGCHTGNAVQVQAGMISSDIPAEGYIPGQTYSITITLNQAGVSRWGFEASPQNLSGAKIGSLVLTNTGQTRLISSGKYVTHTTAGNSGSTGSKSWTFDWVAPVAGTGGFSFYATAMATNNNGNESGDKVFRDELAIIESTSTSVQPHELGKNNLTIFPNPSVGDELHFSLNEPAGELNAIRIYTLTGALVMELGPDSFVQSHPVLTIPSFKLESGSYLLVAEYQKGRFIKRFIRN